MDFEKPRLGAGFEGATRRIWNGVVRGHRESWVLIDRRGEELGEWLRDEDRGTPLRACRAVLDDGMLILGRVHEMHLDSHGLPEDD